MATPRWGGGSDVWPDRARARARGVRGRPARRPVAGRGSGRTAGPALGACGLWVIVPSIPSHRLLSKFKVTAVAARATQQVETVRRACLGSASVSALPGTAGMSKLVTQFKLESSKILRESSPSRFGSMSPGCRRCRTLSQRLVTSQNHIMCHNFFFMCAPLSG